MQHGVHVAGGDSTQRNHLWLRNDPNHRDDQNRMVAELIGQRAGFIVCFDSGSVGVGAVNATLITETEYYNIVISVASSSRLKKSGGLIVDSDLDGLEEEVVVF